MAFFRRYRQSKGEICNDDRDEKSEENEEKKNTELFLANIPNELKRLSL